MPQSKRILHPLFREDRLDNYNEDRKDFDVNDDDYNDEDDRHLW